ncbi:alpha/beta hydrolase [Streptomyces sp. ME01-24h]|nr:alpha/beta hydrolase [Streptomyces sp. ME19-03-3]MDX3356537.1 alpha/beta hydrolase [Streptomyces sp. ME01-24h]
MNRTPVVFIHGAWLHALSWESWAERFTIRGYDVFTPGWPGEGATVRETRERPETLGEIGLDALTHHYGRIVRSFARSPVIVGHAVGGLIAQHLIGASLGRAAVAIAPVPVNGLPPTASPFRPWTPGSGDTTSGNGRLVSLPRERFRHVFANAVGQEESDRLFERYVVPAPRRLFTDLGHGGADRHPRAFVDAGNAARGPLLMVSGQEDRLAPDSVTRAAYKSYGDSSAVSDLKQFADRGHSMVVDSGWRAVADYVLAWLDTHGIHAVPTEH